MKMITDARSEKAEQVAACPACEMVWWFPKSNEQFRIEGDLQLVGEQGEDGDLSLAQERKQQWGNLSDSAREQFYWNQPGVNFSGEPSPPNGGRDEDGSVLQVPETFLLMLLWPKRVRYLKLGDNYAQEDTLNEDQLTWNSVRVNP
eukprot:CAMPEP_0196582920 /NCGR_PEP_ID=MMETSP1081-20130531/41265_1 /TAXON_ID=36882 /ORGANISM="Pyramimonas amylifera, Strain CCMP720" /LENGTH=145 /DNA_ID=CAMNT_0041903641 /DNA_START=526 /DNA_END=963 /DNA_ORIENTATION=+